MALTLTSFLTFFLFTNITIVVFCLIKQPEWIKRFGVHMLWACLLIMVARLFLPFEFPFAKAIAISRVFPEIVRFLRTTLAQTETLTLRLYHAVALVWAAGALFRLGKTVYSYFWFRRLMLESVPGTDRRLTRIAKSINRECGRNKRFTLITSAVLEVPIVFGVFKPVIVIPAIDMSDEEVRLVLLHEMAHYYQGDLWVKLLAELLCCLYWWNPLMPRFQDYIAKALEMRVDDRVIKNMDEPEILSYLECLVKIAKNKAQLQWMAPTVVLGITGMDRSTLKERFKLMLREVKTSRKQRVLAFFAVVIMLLVTILSSAFVFEPYMIHDNDAHDSFVLTEEEFILMQNENGGIDLYKGDQIYAYEFVPDSNKESENISNLGGGYK